MVEASSLSSVLAELPVWLAPLEFERPEFLFLLLVIPLVVLISWRSMRGIERWRRTTSIIVRCLVVALFVATAAGVIYVRPNKNMSVIFLLDQSRSVVDASPEMAEEMRNNQLEYVRLVTREAMPEKDRAGVISFAGQANIEQLPARGEILSDKLSPVSVPDHTNLGQALRLAFAIAPQDTATRVVLVTDGNENVGDLLLEADVAAAAGIPIDVLHVQYDHANEIMFDRIVVPAQAEKDQEVPIKLVIRSERKASGRVTLYHDGVPVPVGDGQTSMRVDLVPGPNTLVTRMTLRRGGPHRFRAVFEPDDPGLDKIVENNVATGLTLVQGKGEVLILSANPQDDQPLYDALVQENISATLKDVAAFELDLLSLQQYACVILANVPANVFNEQQHKALASYVKDLGNGLIMTGGDEGFAAGGWIGSPVEEVMPVTFEIKHKKVIPQGALVVILHSCELPRGNYWGKRVAIQALRTISSRDYFGTLAYTWNPGGVNWEVPIQLARNKPKMEAAIDRVQIGDMPDFASTMDMALKGLRATKASQKHIIIISDGDPAPPRRQTLQGLVNAGITVSTVGIGYGVHVMERTMRDIASKTGGRFYACRNPQQLPQIFTKEAKVVRRRLIDENPFTPRFAYQLSEITAGLQQGDIPPLGGLVITSPKPQAEIPLDRPTDDGDDPVLAHWQYELGRSVAFTSGWWPYWGQDWAGWSRFSTLWAQAVRWCMGQEDAANFDVQTYVSGGRGYVVIDALTTDTSFLNFLEMDGAVISPGLKSQKIRPVQTGPGHYEASFDINEHGQYLVSMEYGKPGQPKQRLRAGLAVPYAQEFRDLKSNEPLLAQVTERTGGKFLTGDPKTDDVFRHTLPPALSREPVWMWVLMWLLIPLFLLDVAVRRLASTAALSVYVELAVLFFVLFGCGVYAGPWWGWVLAAIFAEAVGWAIRWRSIRPTIDSLTYTVATLSSAGQRSGESLAQLREARQRVREELDEGRRSDQPAPDSSARFDIGDEKAAGMDVGDLTKQLGGASAEETAAMKRRRAAQGQGDLADRLMQAKRRARRDIDKRSEHDDKDQNAGDKPQE